MFGMAFSIIVGVNVIIIVVYQCTNAYRRAIRAPFIITYYCYESTDFINNLIAYILSPTPTLLMIFAVVAAPAIAAAPAPSQLNRNL